MYKCAQNIYVSVLILWVYFNLYVHLKPHSLVFILDDSHGLKSVKSSRLSDSSSSSEESGNESSSSGSGSSTSSSSDEEEEKGRDGNNEH